MPGCGTDIQNGRFLWELVPDQTKRRMQDLAEDETYFASQVLACMEEDPIHLPIDASGKKKKSYDLWVRTGPIKLSKLSPEPEDEFEPETVAHERDEYVFGQITLCNNRIIKIGELPLDCEAFPYYVLKWEARPDSWAGIGIPE
jgi:hypothetical protein